MKRFLYNTYKFLVPAQVKQAIPPSLKAWGIGVLYKITRHPDMAFQHARYLIATGQEEKALELYVRTKKNQHGRYNQQTKSHLTHKDIKTVDDPLFYCTLKGVVKNETDGHYDARFGYMGLKISGAIKAPPSLAPENHPRHLDILLDDHLLRRERLNFIGQNASLRFTIKRETLNLFPSESVLSIRTSQDRYLTFGRRDAHVQITVPHGQGGIFETLDSIGPLDKKGWPRLTAEAMHEKQNRYLDLYSRASQAFMEEFNKPLFLLYGTLLGQHRGGDFIPGDDDFDVGYVSEHTTPEAVKAEAIDIMERLVKIGFIIILNRAGKPHRLRDAESGAEIHLDNRPVFSRNDDHVWMHKLARLPMSLEEFRHVEVARLRDTEVFKPRGTEEFLAAYYGPGWRVPDPGFSNASKVITPEIEQSLDAICLTHKEQKALSSKLAGRDLPGSFIPIAVQSLYPLSERFESSCVRE